MQPPGAGFPGDEDDVVRSIGGMLAAGAGFPKAFASALHELRRHHQLRNLHAAVVQRDDELVKAYVREALRFRPVFPMLVRFCPRATRLGDGSAACPRIDVAAGSSVAFFPLSAMFDSAHVERPDDFVVGRPAEAYNLFGGAPRSCIAEALILEFFLPMFEVLLGRVPQIMDGGAPGRFRHDGAGVESYVLDLPGPRQ
jgi:cytochrome P450